MINGWCIGVAFTAMISCDLAIAADSARFGLSEINWGIIPAGIVTKAVASVVNHRDALYLIMTGETFDGRRAAEIGLVNEAVPLARLRERTTEIARKLLEKNPAVLKAAKHAYRRVLDMSWDDAEDYLFAKNDQSRFLDPERGRDKGMSQFLDDKTYKPALEPYRRDG
jgi:feruloyl-CoA hydratase/lyase